MATYTRDYKMQTEEFDFSIELIVPQKIPYGETLEVDRVSLLEPGFNNKQNNVSLKREKWNVGFNVGYVDSNIHIHRLKTYKQKSSPSISGLIASRVASIEEDGDKLQDTPIVFTVNDRKVIRYIYEGSNGYEYGIFYEIIASDGYLIGVSFAVIYNATSEKNIPWLQQQVFNKAEKMISSFTLNPVDNSSLFLKS
jgi:hypothetical protein